MTNEEFFKVLKQVAKRHPFAAINGMLRTLDKDLCPVCAVARKVLKKKFDNGHHILALGALGMDYETWANVVHCADNYGEHKVTEEDVYQQLTAACFPAQEV